MNRKNNKGQSLVETALVLPIILILLLGIIEFGLLFNNYLIVSNASREGARTAAIGASDSDIVSLVDSVATTLDISELTVTITPAQAARKKGDEVEVVVTYDYNLITPIISGIIPGPVQLTGRSVMRVE